MTEYETAAGLSEAEAFPGFDVDTWRTFERDGILVFPGGVPPERVAALTEEMERVAALLSEVHEREVSRIGSAIAFSEAFLELIDDPAHFGFAYDLFGELTTLHYAHAFVRRPGLEADNAWHFDGPRVTPHHHYATGLPLILKVGWWLSDTTRSDAGNFVYLPGSHHSLDIPAARTHEPAAGEVVLRVPPGTVTVMHGGLWHRVLSNRSDRTRLNLFFAYCPSWLAPQETYEDMLDSPVDLTRRRRRLLRTYRHAHQREAPPDEDLPLLGGAQLAAAYGPSIRKSHRRYTLRIERLLV